MASLTFPSNHLSSINAKTVIITGGSGGIGAATATLFHAHGANVVIADLPSTESQANALIASLSQRAVFVPTDILDWLSMKSLFQKTKARFGSVDIVVANAGMMETRNFFDEEFDEVGELKEPVGSYNVIDVNLKGTMNTTKLALHYLRQNPVSDAGSRGSIILVSSTSGYFGGTSVVAYVSSKHGVTGLLRSSQRAAKAVNVTVNAVAPFFTPTNITSSFSKAWKDKGLLENSAQDVAYAVACMVADSKRTGQCCLVAGGVMKEIEKPHDALTEQWLGKDIVHLMSEGGKLFEELGGYPLPKYR
ncbi:hypothetical protein BKA64DRAFT_616535 [Cadophora sp. MPI-SDFR-AT-0126]|nr:hypothetical protein BKA64DRAFT_616535 [Leotiomycetes sp. MPI-SDFR-AT-0126]